jgi:hypothetical protein
MGLNSSISTAAAKIMDNENFRVHFFACNRRLISIRQQQANGSCLPD